MLPFLAAPFLAVRRKHISLRPLRYAWELIPLLLTELLHLSLQVGASFGFLGLLPYARAIQSAFLLSLLFPILRHGLYKPALWGAGCTVAGTLLNRLVMAANGGKMPVYPTLSQLTGYCTRDMLLSGADGVHVLMDAASGLRPLADWIDLGFCILSPGDVLIHLFVSLVLYHTLLSLRQPA